VRYDSLGQLWTVNYRQPDGADATMHSRVLISAVGIFNPAQRPAIHGLETFDGPCFHTTAWPADLDLAGKRVAIVGNGATAMQIVPAIVGVADQITVYQRSPHWVVPFEKFNMEIPTPVRQLLRDVPIYESWYRARLAWAFNDKTHVALQKDPDWPHPDRSLNATSEGYRQSFIHYIQTELGGRTDLLDALVPTYPPFGKRLLLDNGWYRSLTRADVELVTERIERVFGQTVSTTGGSRTHDILVLATGFDVVNFLTSYEVTGRDGRELRAEWGENAQAYLGTTVPGYPNLFILYGPNLQPGHGGSIVFTIERQLNYILGLLRHMSSRDYGAIECKQETSDRYNATVDAAHERMVWTHPGMATYYRNSAGRVVVNTPFRNVDFFHATQRVDPEDYDFEARRTPGRQPDTLNR
jgi:4-hydroxyacetophenone monooxygenase